LRAGYAGPATTVGGGLRPPPTVVASINSVTHSIPGRYPFGDHFHDDFCCFFDDIFGIPALPK